MRPALVITDIDGTLVPRRKALTPRAKKAIQTMQEHGILFGLASGRALEEMFPYLEQWGITAQVLIGFNGCAIWDEQTNERQSFFPMKQEWMKETFEIMKPFDVVPNIFKDGYNYFGGDYDMSGYPPLFKYKFLEDDCFYQQESEKIMWRLRNADEMESIEKRVKEWNPKEFQGFKTGDTVFEFSNRNVSKGFALRQYCENKGLDISNVMAIGDTTNDNALLTDAGISVCLLNGTEDTKACSDYITDLSCEDDGWADFIEKNIIIPNHW